MIAEQFPFRVDGATLTVRRFYQASYEDRPTIVFLPGWASNIHTWRYFLPELHNHFNIAYFESREKARMAVASSQSLEMSQYVNDVLAYLSEAKLIGRSVLVGASLGGTMVLELLCRMPEAWSRAVVISPNVRMPFPRYFAYLRLIPPRIINSIKPAVLLLAKASGRRRDPSQLAGMLTAIRTANLSNLLLSYMALRDYRMDTARLQDLKTRLLLVTASADNFHAYSDAQLVQRRVPESEELDLGTFRDTHGTRSARLIANWLLQHG